MTKVKKYRIWIALLLVLIAGVGGYVYYRLQQRTVLKLVFTLEVAGMCQMAMIIKLLIQRLNALKNYTLI